jgi:dephospho-CoA kinase
VTPDLRPAGAGVPPRYLIGLTGNIATGKSTVAEMLADLGATTIDADRVVHQLMHQDSEMRAEIVRAFGADILNKEAEIDRERLGRIVFNDPLQLRRLEEIIHPVVGREVRSRVVRARSRVVAVEAIKLIEAGWQRSCDALWVTTCPREQQIQRLVTKRSLSREQARARVEAQPPQSEKVRLADVVIDTSGTLDDTYRQVRRAWRAAQRGESHE